MKNCNEGENKTDSCASSTAEDAAQREIVITENLQRIEDVEAEKKSKQTVQDLLKRIRLYSTQKFVDFLSLLHTAKKKLHHHKNVLKNFLFADTIEEAHYRLQVAKTLEKQLHAPLKTGVIIIAVCISFFCVWGMLAPLDTASYAPGHIELVHHAKIIQHPEGGIIQEILVKDGDYVQKDQPLIILNPLNIQTQLNIIQSHLRVAIATEKRLSAEMLHKEDVDFSDPLLDQNDNAVQVILKNQRSIFESKRKQQKEYLHMLESREQSYQQAIIGQEGVLESLKQQLKFVKKEQNSLEALYKQQFVSRSVLIHKQSEAQQITGNINNIIANIASTKERVQEIIAERNATEQQLLHHMQEEYRNAHSTVMELKNKFQNIQEVLQRTIIRAPNEGTVLNLMFHSKWGVIPPNMRIMELVPKNDELIAEVKVNVRDIDNIHIGSYVKLSLDAYKARFVPRIEGKVIYISAHKVQPIPGMHFECYLARIKINQDVFSRLTTKVELYPGMPVTAYIITGTRTFMQILLSPILDSFHRAFKET